MGGLPTQEDEIRERLRNAPDIVLAATLEREYGAAQRLRSRLELVELRIRLIHAEQDGRLIHG